MFELSKILPRLFLPPGLFLLLLGLVFFLVRRRRGGAALAILAALMGLGYLLSIEPVSDWLLLPLENSFPRVAAASVECDVVVVLGGGLGASGPAPRSQARPGSHSMARALAALRVWRRIGAPIVVSGYAERPGAPAVAEAMAKELEGLGVASEALVVEPGSRNTFENAKNTAAILDDRGWARPCLITSAYHMPRAMLAFRYFQVHPLAMPAHYLAGRAPYHWRSYLPAMRALGHSTIAVREYLGLVFYRSFYR